MDENSRRRFFKVAFATSSAAIAGVVGGPVAVAFLDPTGRRTVDTGQGLQPYGKPENLPLGVPRKVDVVSRTTDAWDRSGPKAVGAIWLVRNTPSDIRAFSGICPHLGCPIGYDERQKVFACPCHDSAWAPGDGARLRGPAPRGLDPLPIEIKDGKVFVAYKQFVQGIPERREG